MIEFAITMITKKRKIFSYIKIDLIVTLFK